MAEYESKAEAIRLAGAEKVDTARQILSAEVRLGTSPATCTGR